MKNIRVVATIVLLGSLAFAHRVNIFAQVEGDSVVGQCYYSDGTPVRNQKVEVLRSSGAKLLELMTDDDGYFKFSPGVREDLKIVLYAGMGHKAEITVEARVLPEVTKPHTEKPKSAPKKSEVITEEHGLDTLQLRKIIKDVVDEKFNTLQELIAKQQRSISMTAIIGGIGYIFGIFGLYYYFRSKKRQ
jgi:nickel transport protein